jgi:hypothetical protein
MSPVLLPAVAIAAAARRDAGCRDSPSITLDANRSIAVYSRTVLLTGALRNAAQAGDSVTIVEPSRP